MNPKLNNWKIGAWKHLKLSEEVIKGYPKGSRLRVPEHHRKQKYLYFALEASSDSKICLRPDAVLDFDLLTNKR